MTEFASLDEAKAAHAGHSVRRDDVYDAYYCANCNEWLESQCSDEECGFCGNRPRVPLLAWRDADGNPHTLLSGGAA